MFITNINIASQITKQPILPTILRLKLYTISNTFMSNYGMLLHR